MPIQEILTYAIITAACAMVGVNLYKTLFPPKKQETHGCSGNCNCDAVKVRKELLAHKKLKESV
jgi:hypothetical protein